MTRCYDITDIDEIFGRIVELRRDVGYMTHDLDVLQSHMIELKQKIDGEVD